MVSPRDVAVLVVALVIGAALLAPVTSTVTDNTGDVVVENENLSASIGEWDDLDGTNVDDTNVTVEYDDGTGWSDATEGTDYELNASTGSVQFLDGGAVSSGDDVRASYTYQATSGMVTSVVDLIPLFLALLLLVALARPIMDGI